MHVDILTEAVVAQRDTSGLSEKILKVNIETNT